MHTQGADRPGFEPVRFPRRDHIALFAADPWWLPALVVAAPGGMVLRVSDSWDAFLDTLPQAACCIVAAHDLRDDGLRMKLAESERAWPLVPRAIVTSRGASNLACLTGVIAERVSLLDDSPDHIREAVAEALVSPLAPRLARAVLRSPQLAHGLRQALSLACTSTPPINTVARLAQTAGLSRSSLAEQWHRGVHGSPVPRLEDVLHHLELIHALEARAGGTAERDLARRTGVSTKTLMRRRRAAGIPATWLRSPRACRRAARVLGERLLAILGRGLPR